MEPLVRAYHIYNRKYFNNQLPTPPEINLRWEKMGDCLGYYDQNEEKIAIAAKIKRWDRTWRGTVLHEMVHLKLGCRAGHGPKFQAEMLRLAEAGAFKDLW